MAYLMFAFTELLGFVVLYFTYRGVFSLLTAFFIVMLMLGLSFHVFVRKPDGTSIRMACFTAVLWVSALFSANLFFEFRSLIVSGAALLFGLLSAGTAAFATYSLIQRPPDLDVD